MIAVVAYILIDRRLRQQQEKRAYTAIYFILTDVIARIRYLSNWLEETKDLEFDRVGYGKEFAVPTSLKSNPVDRWEKWWSIEITQTLSTDFLWNLDKALNRASILFSYVIMLWEASQTDTALIRWSGERMHRSLLADTPEVREDLISLFRGVQQKVHSKHHGQDLIDRLVHELKVQDERSISTFSGDHSPSENSEEEDADLGTPGGLMSSVR